MDQDIEVETSRGHRRARRENEQKEWWYPIDNYIQATRYDSYLTKLF
jgi:hypothetical protein